MPVDQRRHEQHRHIVAAAAEIEQPASPFAPHRRPIGQVAVIGMVAVALQPGQQGIDAPSHLQIDGAGEDVRIDAGELGAKVVGPVPNLGFPGHRAASQERQAGGRAEQSRQRRRHVQSERPRTLAVTRKPGCS
jgi:hypothetical protein